MGGQYHDRNDYTRAKGEQRDSNFQHDFPQFEENRPVYSGSSPPEKVSDSRNQPWDVGRLGLGSRRPAQLTQGLAGDRANGDCRNAPQAARQPGSCGQLRPDALRWSSW